MSRITVIGGTGYAGSAIAQEAAARHHQVTVLSTRAPESPVADVEYVQGDATDRSTLSRVIDGADAVVAALAPRGPLTDVFREVNRTIAQLTDAAGARLYVVGGFSSLRPARGADRFVTDLSDVPVELHAEIRNGAALIIEDLPATADTLHWVFVSPAKGFGAYTPRETLGRYRLGDDVAVEPEDGGVLSAADYARGFIDVIEDGTHRRTQVNLGNPS